MKKFIIFQYGGEFATILEGDIIYVNDGILYVADDKGKTVGLFTNWDSATLEDV